MRHCIPSSRRTGESGFVSLVISCNEPSLCIVIVAFLTNVSMMILTLPDRAVYQSACAGATLNTIFKRYAGVAGAPQVPWAPACDVLNCKAHSQKYQKMSRREAIAWSNIFIQL